MSRTCGGAGPHKHNTCDSEHGAERNVLLSHRGFLTQLVMAFGQNGPRLLREVASPQRPSAVSPSAL